MLLSKFSSRNCYLMWGTDIFCFPLVVLPISYIWLFATPWTACQSSLSIIISLSLLKLMSFESVMPTISFSIHPFSSWPSIFPASKSSNEWALRISWPMYWRFSFSISPSYRSCIILNSKFTFTILFKLMLSRVKQITSPGGMHETSAWAWCTGKT